MNIFLFIILFLATLCYFAATFRWVGKPGRFALFLFSCALACFTISKGPSAYYSIHQEKYLIPLLSSGNIIWVVGIPVIIVGMLSLPSIDFQKLPIIQKAKAYIDILLLLSILTTLCWYFVFLPIFDTRLTSSAHALQSLFQPLIFSLVAIGIIYVAIIMLVRIPHEHAYFLPVLILLTGIIVVTIAELSIVSETLYFHQQPALEIWPNSLLHIGYICFFLSGVIFCLRVPSDTDPSNMNASLQDEGALSFPLFIAKTMLPSIFATGVSLVLLLIATITHQNTIVAYISMAVLIFLVGLRQTLVIVDNYTLYQDEHKALAQLEQAVQENEVLNKERMQAESNEIILRETNRRMDEFMSIASHELRTPITSAKATLQLMARRFQKVKASRLEYELLWQEVLDPALDLEEKAESQMNRQIRLITDLLDITRIQSGQLQLQFTQCNIIDLIREITEEQQLINQRRQIELILSDMKDLQAEIDRDRIGQVLSNFISNACKYSPENTPVLVQAQRTSQEVIVTVKDHGAGLTTEAQQHIWDRFYRVKDSDEHSDMPKKEGLGLGLYICKNIIDIHKGSVGIESMPGSGSTFWFSLPVLSSPEQKELKLLDIVT